MWHPSFHQDVSHHLNPIPPYNISQFLHHEFRFDFNDLTFIYDKVNSLQFIPAFKVKVALEATKNIQRSSEFFTLFELDPVKIAQ